MQQNTARQTRQVQATSPAHPVGDARFCLLLGRENWDRLPAPVRARFSKRLNDGKTALYSGMVLRASMHPLGWLLAQAARLVGAPLPTRPDVDVPAAVSVTEDTATGGQTWTRIYGRPTGFPQVINSVKRFTGPTGLEEHVGRGIGMALQVSSDDQGITFKSDHYFLQLGAVRLRLPRWLSPGTVTVKHVEQGDGAFLFELTLEHPLIGTLLQQTALFHDTTLTS